MPRTQGCLCAQVRGAGGAITAVGIGERQVIRGTAAKDRWRFSGFQAKTHVASRAAEITVVQLLDHDVTLLPPVRVREIRRAIEVHEDVVVAMIEAGWLIAVDGELR